MRRFLCTLLALLLGIRVAVALSCSDIVIVLNNIPCTPNCDDGISYCELDHQACLNDNLGGCYDPPAPTLEAIVSVFQPVATQFVTAAGSTVVVIITQYVSAFVTNTATETTVRFLGCERMLPSNRYTSLKTLVETASSGSQFITETVTVTVTPDARRLRHRQGVSVLPIPSSTIIVPYSETQTVQGAPQTQIGGTTYVTYTQTSFVTVEGTVTSIEYVSGDLQTMTITETVTAADSRQSSSGAQSTSAGSSTTSVASRVGEGSTLIEHGSSSLSSSMVGAPATKTVTAQGRNTAAATQAQTGGASVSPSEFTWLLVLLTIIAFIHV